MLSIRQFYLCKL